MHRQDPDRCAVDQAEHHLPCDRHGADNEVHVTDGAVGERPGRFESANGGALFLDEVGELPLSVQAKLLRDLVRDGAFRADLYHRLSVYPVPILLLRERGDDVLLLAGRFLELNCARLGLRSLRLSADAQAMVQQRASQHGQGRPRQQWITPAQPETQVQCHGEHHEIQRMP